MKKLLQLIFLLSYGSLSGQTINCELFDYMADTTFQNGSFLNYELADNQITTIWGTSSFKRTLPPFACDIAPTRIPTVEWTNSKFIVLRFGCGNPCWASIILPLNKDDSVQTLYYSYAWDVENSQIAYLDGDILTIVELTTRRTKEFSLDPTCRSAFAGYCIDSLNISSNELYVKWLTGEPLDAAEFKEFRGDLKFDD